MLLLVDQQLREGETVPFFGYPAKTAVAHIKLAAKTGKPIFMAQTVRGRAATSKSLFLHRFICSKQLMTKTAERSQNRSISRLKHG